MANKTNKKSSATNSTKPKTNTKNTTKNNTTAKKNTGTKSTTTKTANNKKTTTKTTTPKSTPKATSKTSNNTKSAPSKSVSNAKSTTSAKKTSEVKSTPKEAPNKKKIVLLILIIITLGGTLIAGYEIYKWKVDGNKTKEQIEELEKIPVVEKEDTEQTEVIEQPEEIDKSNPYWDYIKMNLIDVDFNELTSINSDTVAWLQLGGTNINYPVVQAADNDYYLTRSFDKSSNSAGWVFMDYRNNASSFDQNTIIYAHGRYDNTMFGSLKNIFKGNWLNNSDNYIVKMSTPIENTLWQVFSIYIIPVTSDYLYTNFTTQDEFVEFGNMLMNRSEHNFNTTINPGDKILTLSTCYDGDKERVVLHAKLIKRESKVIE